MTTTTETGVWILKDASMSEPITFCAACALREINRAFLSSGIAPASTMSEAALVLEMNLTIGGDPEASTLLTYAESGRCENCGKEVTPNPTQETGDPIVSTAVKFYTPKDDQNTLCGTCGVAELNNSFAVLIGLRPPFESMQQVIEEFSSVEDIGPDYFAVSDHGKCLECGAEAKPEEVEDTDVA